MENNEDQNHYEEFDQSDGQRRCSRTSASQKCECALCKLVLTVMDQQNLRHGGKRRRAQARGTCCLICSRKSLPNRRFCGRHVRLQSSNIHRQLQSQNRSGLDQEESEETDNEDDDSFHPLPSVQQGTLNSRESPRQDYPEPLAQGSHQLRAPQREYSYSDQLSFELSTYQGNSNYHLDTAVFRGQMYENGASPMPPSYLHRQRVPYGREDRPSSHERAMPQRHAYHQQPPELNPPEPLNQFSTRVSIPWPYGFEPGLGTSSGLGTLPTFDPTGSLHHDFVYSPATQGLSQNVVQPTPAPLSNDPSRYLIGFPPALGNLATQNRSEIPFLNSSVPYPEPTLGLDALPRGITPLLPTAQARSNRIRVAQEAYPRFSARPTLNAIGGPRYEFPRRPTTQGSSQMAPQPFPAFSSLPLYPFGFPATVNNSPPPSSRQPSNESDAPAPDQLDRQRVAPDRPFGGQIFDHEMLQRQEEQLTEGDDRASVESDDKELVLLDSIHDAETVAPNQPNQRPGSSEQMGMLVICLPAKMVRKTTMRRTCN